MPRHRDAPVYPSVSVTTMEIPFDLALAQTIAWCDPRADPRDPAASLRSVELRPQMLADDREWVVPALAAHRSYADAATKMAKPVTTASDLRGGRLLIYFPDAELADGAAEAESGGYFDVFNTPPWDSWVALLRDDRTDDLGYSVYLVCWVPSVFVDIASAGIGVNPEECILWLEEADVPLRDELRRSGLLLS